MLVVALLLALASSAGVARAEPLAVWAHAAPDFTLPTLGRGLVAPGRARRRVAVVHFFATWCEPCREELPALQAFARSAADEIVVTTVAVAEPDERVRRFVEAAALDLPLGLDRDQRVARAWGVDILPATVVLGPDLTPRLGALGAVDWAALTPARLVARVNETRPASDAGGARADDQNDN